MLYPKINEFRGLINLSGFFDFKIDPDKVGERENWLVRGKTGKVAPRDVVLSLFLPAGTSSFWIQKTTLALPGILEGFTLPQNGRKNVCG